MAIQPDSKDWESWELNVLGVYDVVSSTLRTGLECWFEFIRSSSEVGMQGDICEFGVFRGRTLIGAALLLSQLGDSRRVIGFDTFSGFPHLSPEDDPIQFDVLANRGQISEEHLRRVRRNEELLRSVGRSLHPRESSTSRDFAETSRNLVETRARLVDVHDRIEIFEGDFVVSLREEDNQERAVSGVLLDSDLFAGYAAALPWAYERLVPGGMIFLDEYYSLKFPGPRLAVDAFCAELGIRPTLLRKDGAFERWAILN